jgi:large-conductance mechanosensitive channel
MNTEDKEAYAAKPSRGARRWGLLVAVAAGGACSIFATFFTQTLRPPRISLVDRYTLRPIPRGQIGSLQEVFYWNDVIRVLVVSLVISVVVWCAIRVAAKLAHEHGRKAVARTDDLRSHPAALAIVDLSLPRQEAV